MKVNDLVSSIGYTRNILSHFSIILYNVNTDNLITIKAPTADEYIHLCDRKIIDWSPEDFFDDDDEKDHIAIYVKMKKKDYETFKSYKS